MLSMDRITGTGIRLTVLFAESSKNFGGQERRIVHEARLLRDAGHRPLILCPPDALLSARAQEAGLAVVDVPMRNAVHVAAIRSFCTVIRREGVNVIYSHSAKDSWLGGIASLLTGVPLVRSRELLNPIKRAASYNLLPKRVLACSNAVREHLIASGVDPRKVYVQYPPVATARFASVADEERLKTRLDLGLDGHFPVIACVAGFRTEKRQEDLIRAMALIRRPFPTARLVLAGSGWYVANLRSFAEEAGVTDLVNCPGEREDVPALLANTDVFVLPSYTEPFGMSPVEAMAAGVPVVVTRTGGLAEIVTDGADGIHVPVCDPEAIAAAVIRICSDRQLRDRLVEAGRRRAGDFDEAKALEGLTAHFRSVMNPRTAQRQ
jgi:glycosyltransferase involved in cell wall biosynthesis